MPFHVHAQHVDFFQCCSEEFGLPLWQHLGFNQSNGSNDRNSQMNKDDLLEAGNSFARNLLLAFAVVYALYVTADHPIDEKAVQSIGQHRIELQLELSAAESLMAAMQLGEREIGHVIVTHGK